MDAAEAERVGLLQKVVSRDAFEDEWRSLARKLAHRAAGEVKRVVGGATPDEAVAAFARLWVDDAHWDAADRVMNRAR
jgi:enoyl-CoA hydratase/carnithine racemase